MIDQIIVPRTKDLGDFTVARVLPYAERRMVGPFIFLDHMGPADFAPEHGIDVRPHPHIGLATVTYLFAGAIQHRDSLGSNVSIVPGDVNWMTAGKGIVHSERSSPDAKAHGQKLHGLQIWVALPKDHEECEPEFFHHAAGSLPKAEIGGCEITVIAGKAFRMTSPVKIFSPLFYAEAKMPAGASLDIPDGYAERAVYLIEGSAKIGGQVVEPRTLPVLVSGQKETIKALTSCHLVMLGGEPFAEPRHIWWNFVSSSLERIETAKQAWRDQSMGSIPDDHDEFIPLPE
jgi:redox-sensitive bicupin YhaK (pirin superfamily)